MFKSLQNAYAILLSFSLILIISFQNKYVIFFLGISEGFENKVKYSNTNIWEKHSLLLFLQKIKKRKINEFLSSFKRFVDETENLIKGWLIWSWCYLLSKYLNYCCEYLMPWNLKLENKTDISLLHLCYDYVQIKRNNHFYIF